MASEVRGKWWRRSREEWRAVLERFAASGQSIRQFCEREGLSKSSLDRWRGLLAGEAPAAADRGDACARTGFVDAGLISGGGGLVLHLVRS
jgi:hypothetical protein